MEGAKVVITLHSSVDTHSPNDGSPKDDPTLYLNLVGSLQYYAFTKPDVSFVVKKLSQYMHAPTQQHWKALKRVLHYLKSTILYEQYLKRGSSLDLSTFFYSDWGGTNRWRTFHHRIYFVSRFKHHFLALQQTKVSLSLLD